MILNNNNLFENWKSESIKVIMSFVSICELGNLAGMYAWLSGSYFSPPTKWRLYIYDLGSQLLLSLIKNCMITFTD